MKVHIHNFFTARSLKRYAFIPLMLCVFYLTFYLFYNDVKKNTIQEFNNEKLLLAKTAAQGISSLLDNYQSNLSFIAKHNNIIDFTDEGKKSMQYFYETHENVIKAITRVDSSGAIIYTYPFNKSIIGRNISNQEHVQQVLSTHQPVISDVFMSVQGYYAIALHVPVFNKNRFDGSLAILIPIDKLGQLFLDNIKSSKKGLAWLITENNTEIYCPIKGHQGKSILETTNNDKSTIEMLEKIKTADSGTGKSIHQDSLNFNSKNLEDMYVVFYHVPHGNTHWTILISYKESEVYLALSKFRNRLILILSVLFIAGTFYFYSLAKVRNILREEAKRREAEMLLRESNERFNSFMENTPIYAYIKDSSLNHIYQNRKVDSLVTQQDLEHISSRHLFNKETADMLENADRQILSGEKENIELIFSTPINGKITWLKDLKFKINISGNKYGVGGAVFDITEIKNYEAELEKHKQNLEILVKKRTKDLESANKKLESLNKELKMQKEEVEATLHALKEAQARMVQSEKMVSLGILTAGVSHEINNPLQYLSGIYYGFTKYFKKYGSSDEQTTNLLLSSTLTAINRISSIVKGLNNLSHDNSDFDEDCDIHLILDNCKAILYSQNNADITFEKHYCSDKMIVKGNTGKLHQVFINVIWNAIQAIEIKGSITITTNKNENNAVIEIIDTGVGISKENLPKITEPFFTTKDPGKGTGLGLSIVYTILQDHRGHIKFESELNKGTKIIITLPLKI